MGTASRSSSFATLVPPRASLGFKRGPAAPLREKRFLYALAAVFVLVLLGGGHRPFAMGLALLCTGLALLLRPPTRSLGRWLDLSSLGFLACGLLSFVPHWIGLTPRWRQLAVQTYAIDLPLTVTLQPAHTWEAWLLLAACCGWLYAVASWEVTAPVRRWLHFWSSVGVALLALLACAATFAWGDFIHSEGSPFQVFADPQQMALLLALGGVTTLAFAMNGVSRRRFLPLTGFISTVLCLAALILIQSGIGLVFYFSGSGIWILLKLRQSKVRALWKSGAVLALLLCFVYSVGSAWSWSALAAAGANGVRACQATLAANLRVILDAPITGVGLGNLTAVAPFYQEAAALPSAPQGAGSGYLWLAASMGLPALVCLCCGLWGYWRRCREVVHQEMGSLRLTSLVAVVLLIFYALVASRGHSIGLFYLAALFATLALPPRKVASRTLPRGYWRAMGGVFVCFAVLWLGGQQFGLATHSKLAASQSQQQWEASLAERDWDQAFESLDRRIAAQPLDWSLYQQRAQLHLSARGDFSKAAPDFERARYLAPQFAEAAYQEGVIWLQYDVKRAMDAWGQALATPNASNDGYFSRIFSMAGDKAFLLERLIELSRPHARHHALVLSQLQGALFTQELERTLAEDPNLAAYHASERSAILKHWIREGDLVAAARFLDSNAERLVDSWYHRALLNRQQARLEDALNQLRAGLPVPVLQTASLENRTLAHLEREYAADRLNTSKATRLLSSYLRKQRYKDVAFLAEQLIEARVATPAIHYWYAESLYHLGDYMESWLGFERYRALSRQK